MNANESETLLVREEDNEEEYLMEGVELTSEGNENNKREDNLEREDLDKDENAGIEVNNEGSPGETFYKTNNVNLQQMQFNTSFNPKSSSLNKTITSNQSYSIKLKEKEPFPSQSQLSVENITKSFPSIDKVPHNRLNAVYAELLINYKKVTKDKAQASALLNKEIVANEQQRAFIAMQKQMINEMIASQKPKSNQSTNRSKGENKSNRDKDDYSELLMEIPKMREKMKDLEIRESQLKDVIESMAQRETDLMSSIEQEAQSRIQLLEKNKSLEAKLKQMENAIEELQAQVYSAEIERNQYKEELAKYKGIPLERDQLKTELNNKRAVNEGLNEKITQLSNDLGKKNQLVKDTEKELVILTIKDKEHRSALAKLTEDIAVLTTDNKLKAEKESKQNETILALNEEVTKLNKEMTQSMKANSLSLNEKDLVMNEHLSSYHQLKRQYETLQNESNNQLILTSALKEEIFHLKKQTQEDKTAILLNSKRLKDNEELIAEFKSKIDSMTNDYTALQSEHKDTISQLQQVKQELCQTQKQTAIQHMEEMTAKDKEIFSLKCQVNNPKQSPNMKYYHPRLAIQSCLIASNHLIESAHAFYSEKDHHIFLESIEALQQELTLCFNSLSNDDETRALTVQNEKCLQELASYRNDNKKLFDYCKELKREVQSRRECNEVYKEYVMRLSCYIGNKAIRESISELIGISLDSIELMREYEVLEERNNLIFKRNESVFGLYNEGKFSEFGVKEQQVKIDYDETNELKQRIAIEIDKGLKRKKDLNETLKEKEMGHH